MKAIRSLSILLVLGVAALTQAAGLPPDIPIDSPWKKSVFEFTNKHLQHSAWGVAHSKRDYLLGMEVAAKEGLVVDEEVMFAAAMLHDMGGFPEFAKPGVDHAVRSAEIVATVLKPAGFPEAKIPAVQKAIITHSYYCPDRPTTPEAIALHDADTLDFLGIISFTRIISLTERDAAAPTLLKAVRTLKSLLAHAPKSLVSKAAQELGKPRTSELSQALQRLRAESYDESAL